MTHHDVTLGADGPARPEKRPENEKLSPLLHTIPEAHGRLRISQSKLFEMIKGGEIRVVKIGRRTLISESEIQRFVQSKLAA